MLRDRIRMNRFTGTLHTWIEEIEVYTRPRD
jgi:hypothetical protein